MEQANYIFEIEKGVSGVLLPDGTFKKCGNAQHHYLLEDLSFEQKSACLYFSSNMNFSGSGLITHDHPSRFKGVTPEQRGWMEQNFKHFDRGQQRRSSLDWGIEQDY
jgi:hypothetical protein